MTDGAQVAWALKVRTLFFRAPHALNLMADYALSQPAGSLQRFLFSPCSIGCEPYSFAMVAELRGVFNRHPDLTLYGLDLSEKFSAIATQGYYPSSVLRVFEK